MSADAWTRFRAKGRCTYAGAQRTAKAAWREISPTLTPDERRDIEVAWGHVMIEGPAEFDSVTAKVQAASAGRTG